MTDQSPDIQRSSVHSPTAMRSRAVFSDDRAYRYLLTRDWGEGPRATFVLLNPSTADEFVNDPTISKCIRFAKRWGLGGLNFVNVYALRSTDPKGLLGRPRC